MILYFLILSLFSLTEAFSYGNIAVIGASGNLGRVIVDQLYKKDISTKILNNNSSKIINYNKEYPNVKIVNGDVNNLDSLIKLLDGVDTCIAVHGSKRKTKLSDILGYESNDLTHPVNVNYIGMINIINAAKITKTKHIIRVTGNGEKPWSLPTIIINLLGSMNKAWNYAGECELRNSNITYTIIRPGIMKKNCNLSFPLMLSDNGNYLPISKISYDNIANLCLECISHPNVKNTTLTAMTTEFGYGLTTWSPLLKKINKDSRKFPNKLVIVLKHYISASFIICFLVIILTTYMHSMLISLINKL